MLTTEENDLLCRVEGKAAMGRLMRQHWLPACMSEEVVERDGTPVRSRLLGEDLVVFRDTEGKLGILGEHCPHRRASLAFGRNEEGGLRCLYHGWKFDVEGKVLDMAEFEPPSWAPTPDTKISIVKMHVQCNWAQVLEGAIDSAHSSSLHSSVMPSMAVEGAQARGTVWPRPSTDKAPRIQYQLTNFGFRYAAIRKPILNAESHDYVRITLFVAPFTVLIPPNDQYKLAQMLIPIDDENTMFYWVAWDETKGIAQDEWRAFCGATVGVDLDRNYRKIRTLDNMFLQDREAMKHGDFTGIAGIPAQDMAMWESMGTITDRTEDYLSASDVAVVQFRRQMVKAVRDVEQGGKAIGTTEPHIPHVKLASFEGIVPKTTSWRTLGVAPEELALREGETSRVA
jgi:phthalate 4,5-dioxygenase